MENPSETAVDECLDFSVGYFGCPPGFSPVQQY